MNKGVFQSSLVQQMMEGSPTWWSMNNMRPPPELTTFPLLPSSFCSSSWSSSSNSSVPQNQPSNVEMNPWQDCQDLPESWCHLLLGGLMGEEEKYGWNPLQTRKMMENCQDQPDQVLYPPDVSQIADIKQECSGGGYVHRRVSEDIQVSKSAWSQILPTSSPRSCITTSFSTNMLDFSNMTRRQRDNSSECNSTETAPAFKKQARVQGSSSPKSTLKVRKEKLGDRITALHQLVSPFGKTDTASVLQEAIGYIRFLQSQIEALSSPYLGSGLSSGNMKQQAAAHQQGNTSCLFSSEAHGQEVDNDEEKKKKKKDLRSRGLCLVPVSFTMHVKYGSDNCEINNGADFWAPSALGGSGF